MFEAVESLVEEHAALEQRMADPAVHADPAQAKKVGQRYAELTAVLRTYREWQQVGDDLEAARELELARRGRVARGAAARARRATPAPARAARPVRRQGRHRRDQGR